MYVKREKNEEFNVNQFVYNIINMNIFRFVF